MSYNERIPCLNEVMKLEDLVFTAPHCLFVHPRCKACFVHSHLPLANMLHTLSPAFHLPIAKAFANVTAAPKLDLKHMHFTFTLLLPNYIALSHLCVCE
jgi:hypothetical protein